MNKEKDFWNNAGYKMFQRDELNNPDVSDYEFNLLKRYNLSNKSLLEVGFGSGRDLEKFDDLNMKLGGIDISDKFTEEANKNFEGSFEVMDVRNIKLWTHGKVDLIYSRWSVLFLEFEEFKQLLKDCKSLLNEDGIMLFSLRAGKDLHNIHKTTNTQSLQLNASNLQKAIPEGMELIFYDMIPYKSSTNSNDKQVTFLISNKEFVNSRTPYKQ